MKNDKRNDTSHLDGKRVKFTSDYQPTPSAKKKGWELRRERQEIADEMMKLKDMPYAELIKRLDDINEHPESYTVKEVKLARYFEDEKLTVDWLNRHIPNAPQNVDLTSGGEKARKFILEFADGRNEDSIYEGSEQNSGGREET